ncbi:MAG TPA: ParA family protein [Roseiflexaceae bacterium]|nr:ParA family protein [Roseiflexaceae bacterium]
MIIATAMQKGGVGKTTTTLALGSELARSGASVLLIDLDPQASLTQGLGYDPTQIECSIYNVLLQPSEAEFATLHPSNGLDVLPATLDLAGAELSFAGRFGRELLLREALEPLHGQYDYILIDSPPSLGLFTVNALTAADVVLVPLQAHVFALAAMDQLESTIRMIAKLNPKLHIGGILITMVDRRTSVNALIEQEARQRYGDLVFQATIPLNTKIVEAPAVGQSITVYAPDSMGAQAYRALAEEVRERWPIQGGRHAT